ncbi:uncharacterized protein LOC127794958 [Diospyros lotus]|uniref:uncharacterized protein LOC127794958 n=1 Tax=Diospyros lotus TaxID=55363 RepID=UPI0022567A45|nr:uncharacterized protein LOC127794958 [Diospyros lotus]
MVQRKVTGKLGIQANHVKSEKILRSLGPSSPRHPDGKSRMKKSRSIKRPDYENLRSSPSLRREQLQPGRPPPLVDAPAAAATPQRQFSPNYMKSTSSFEARKERSPVSSHNSPASVDSKRSKQSSKNSKLGSVSGQKSVKTLTRTSSLKLVRTLTKSPSFKPARSSLPMKCSEVVLCENLNAQRATCSSTLKDSKLPPFLALSPGATESEGTSAMKVCPYTYCSLNGHHHPPLPPLKCFLSARRHMLKTQKSVKMGCLSPRRRKEKPATYEEDLDSSVINPLMKEEEEDNSMINPLMKEEEEEEADHMDFFIKIYVKDVEDSVGTTGGGEERDNEKDKFLPLVGGANETVVEEDGGGQGFESGLEVEPCPEIDFEGNLDETSHSISNEMEIAEFFSEEQNVEAGEEVCSPLSVQEQESPDCLSDQSDLEVESSPSTEFDGTDSETSDMEWEEGQYSAPFVDDEAGNLAQTNNGSDPALISEPAFKSVGLATGCFDEISADAGLEEFFEQVSESPGASDLLHNFAEPDPEEVYENKTEVSEGALDKGLLLEGEVSIINQVLKQEQATADAGDETNKREPEAAARSLIGIPSFESLQCSSEAENDIAKEVTNEIKLNTKARDSKINQAEAHAHSSDKESQSNNQVEDQNNSEKDCNQTWSFKISDSVDSENQTHPGLNKVTVDSNSYEDVNQMEVERSDISDPEQSFPSTKLAASRKETKTAFTRGTNHSSQEPAGVPINLRITRGKMPVEELEESKKFNPREPNYLPIELDPEAEKVDLRHQMVDERKNAEEWMVDYALQQAVAKLAPARKRKVALLVEAFEKVTPMSKYGSHVRHTSPAFVHARTIQACN